jgi:hypothetical protein
VVPETDTLKFPCWAKGVANTLAGKSETNTTSNATVILQWCRNRRSYEGNYLGFLAEPLVKKEKIHIFRQIKLQGLVFS